MRSNVFWGIAVTIAVLIVVFWGYISLNNLYISDKIDKESTPSALETDNYLWTNNSDEFYLYTNERLGFSIEIPKSIAIYCGPPDLDCLDRGVVSIIEGEDSIGLGASGFNMIFKQVRNESELANFIKDINGEHCESFSVEPNISYEGIFDIKVNSTDIGDPSTCQAFFFQGFYSPKKERAVLIQVGQETQFQRTFIPCTTRKEDGIFACDPPPYYDLEVVNSFRFLD
ncbi:MAG TPA: hypothetical protein VI432_00955 [Candidatus Paceibacterota bacterium]